MTIYLVRLRGNAVPPADRASTIGMIHILDPELQRGQRWAFSGMPTVCGRELMSLNRRTLWQASEILWQSLTIEPDMLDWRCKICFKL